MPYKPKTFRPAGAPTKEQLSKAFDKQREIEKPWRKWYRCTRWRKARETFLSRNPLCVDCKEQGVVTAATDVDHQIPHRGDSRLFWDSSNWRARCHACHSRKTGRGE